jgi:carbamoyl-phosphate synthase small subunit
VQYHPEASPGPHDSLYLFDEFVRAVQEQASDDGEA